MKIGILGCGYVGQAAAHYWKLAGHHISVTTRKQERIASLQQCADEVHLIQDLLLFPFLSEIEALLVSVAPDSNSTYLATYLQTAQQIAEHLPRLPKLKHILYTSSTSVYGDFQGDWVDEATPLAALSDNGRCLYQTEQTFLETTVGRVVIFRLGEIYGPGRYVSDRLRRSPTLTFPGTGNQYTNLIHLTDIVRALDFALAKSLHGLFNLCNDLHLPRREFYDKLCQQANLPKIAWDPSRASPHGGNKKVSNQKIKNLGFAFLENDCSH
ncbi:conserved hypothetical protein [Candidatus Protochlamydia naegleriophila]|uniref:NAD-dependent epimerase/dehydratase domain-containing protein n=1 Tax=Candidatus Protochlamydia naegleriophila TaxID=389348 RepID=A0A0U5JB31_9BACT|nr:SDR family oxidoreductase [Candidatus Protochlamydia naegleriophila]CUI16327.1 conserved hypothetical protein [Candidatus Protochlamydia naegleriophila]